MLALAVEYRITTPEQVSFRYEVAGVVSRAMGWLIDQLMVWALRVLVVLAVGWTLPGLWAGAVGLVGVFAVAFAYFIIAELSMAGQTPGKRLFRVRVVCDDGTRLTGTAVLVRNLLRPVDSLPLFMLVGGAVALFDRYHRRLGDLAAGTLAVREVTATIPTALSEAQARHNTFQADPAVRQRILNRVSRPERDLLYELMLRRDALDPTVREQLFARAAAHCRSRFQLPSDLEHLTDEQTVMNVTLVIHRSDTQMQRRRRPARRPARQAAG